MKIFKLLKISLSLFDGGAAGGGDGAGGGAADGQGAQAVQGAVSTQKAGMINPGSSRRAKSAGLANVVYGTQAGAQATQTEASKADSPAAEGNSQQTMTPEEKRAKFKELISSEYKDVYTQEFQSAFDRRFKQAKETEERLNAMQPIVDNLLTKYRIEDGDVKKLAEAIDQDYDMWADAADEAGMSVEQYKEFTKLKRYEQMVKQMQQQTEAQQAAQQQLTKWQAEADSLKAVYSDFELADEVKNPRFLAMLKSGVPIKDAYEVAHLDDIKTGVAASTAKQTEKKVVDTIRAKGSRPPENGVSSNSGVIVKTSAASLNKRDRAEIARRVQRGETITLG